MAHYVALTAAAVAAGAIVTVCSWIPPDEAFQDLLRITVDAISVNLPSSST